MAYMHPEDLFHHVDHFIEMIVYSVVDRYVQFSWLIQKDLCDRFFCIRLIWAHSISNFIVNCNVWKILFFMNTDILSLIFQRLIHADDLDRIVASRAYGVITLAFCSLFLIMRIMFHILLIIVLVDVVRFIDIDVYLESFHK